ncbi:MAG: YqiA/YcfP family alpha/beta fold hydrolase [Porphyromonadaceae bacterium]|nr:YqiA/YcfP family alpha/beta fold hydrolase [Porphyromonadaceae bacterium]
MTKRILYIHGLSSSAKGSTATILKEQLNGKIDVIAPSFNNEVGSFDNLLCNIRKAQTIIQDQSIDLLVGSSMGGFTALHVGGIPTLVINPCMKPSEHFQGHLLQTSQKELDKYKMLEREKPSSFQQHHTYALFAKDDELFSYRTLFDNLYNKDHSRMIDGSHVNSKSRVVEEIIPSIEKLLTW